MNLYFIDEFKEQKGNIEIYGIALVRINNASYGKFKKGFYSKLKKLGWDQNVEIKGRHSFSSSKGDVRISVDDRLIFAKELFELSASGSGSYAIADVFFSFDLFKKGTRETLMYEKLLYKIIKKLPKGTKGGNRNGKNNALFSFDRNDSIDLISVNNNVEKLLNKRGLYLIEKCYFINSDNNTPGIIFADHIAYFIRNFIKTRDFNKKSEKEFKQLLLKYQHTDPLSNDEMSKLEYFLVSIEKESKSIDLIGSLKKNAIDLI